MINHIDPRSPNTREPETAEDNPPGTLEEVAPDDPADKPGHEEQYEETPPSDRATVKGKAMLSFVLSNAEIIPDPTDPPMPDPMPDPIPDPEVPDPDPLEPLPMSTSAIIPEDPSTPDPNEDPGRPPPVEDPIDPLEPPIDEPDPVDPPVEEPPPGWGA